MKPTGIPWLQMDDSRWAKGLHEGSHPGQRRGTKGPKCRVSGPAGRPLRGPVGESPRLGYLCRGAIELVPVGDFCSRLDAGTEVLGRGLSTFVGSPLLRPAAEWGRTGGCVPGVAPWGPFRSSDLEGRAWDRFPCDPFGTPGLRTWTHQLRFSRIPSLGL